MIEIAAGSVNVTLEVYARDAISGLPKTGIAYSAVASSYARTRSARVAIPVVTLASVTAAHSDGGWREIDAVNMPGWYRFDLPDAALAAGADGSVVTVLSAGALVYVDRIRLVAAADVAVAVGQILKFVGNSRVIDQSGAPVETILADDGVTPWKTITHTETAPGVILEEVADPA
jgi:hypothetical protein